MLRSIPDKKPQKIERLTNADKIQQSFFFPARLSLGRFVFPTRLNLGRGQPQYWMEKGSAHEMLKYSKI
jgi:hypothetical protein